MAVAASGCTSLALPSAPSWIPGADQPPEPPNRMVAIWTDAIMNQPGLPGVRGIGGKLMFYRDQSEMPLTVDGKLTVYAYDDSDDAASDKTPARRFVFLPEELAERHSVSKLGDAYNLWLPWDEVGNPARHLTLIARFEPAHGAVVLSDPSRQLLPGSSVTPEVSTERLETNIHAASGGRSAVVPASFEAATVGTAANGGSQATPAGSLETFTIDLPADVARRWNAAHSNVEQAALSTTTTTSAAWQAPAPMLPIDGNAPPAVPTADEAVIAPDELPPSLRGARIESAAPERLRPIRRHVPRRLPNPDMPAKP